MKNIKTDNQQSTSELALIFGVVIIFTPVEAAYKTYIGVSYTEGAPVALILGFAGYTILKLRQWERDICP
jgi:hypothetical protein